MVPPGHQKGIRLQKVWADAVAAPATVSGEAALTSFGARLIEQYRAMEAEAYSATAARLNELDAACRGTPTTPSHAAVRRCTIAR